MDPFSAISLASSIIQFVDFTMKVISESRELHNAASGSLKGNESIEDITRDLLDLTRKLNASHSVQSPELDDLCAGANAVALELLEALEKLRVKGVRSGVKTIRKALRSVWSKVKLEEIERKLAMYRDTINLRVLVNFRTQFDLVALRSEGRFDALDTSARSILDSIIASRDVFEVALEEQTETLREFHANTEATVAQAHMGTRSHFTEVLRVSDMARHSQFEKTHRDSEKLQETLLQVVREMKQQGEIIEQLKLERQRDIGLQERLDWQERLNAAYRVMFQLAIALAALQVLVSMLQTRPWSPSAQYKTPMEQRAPQTVAVGEGG